MRLDELLASSYDVTMLVTKHLETHALVRLGLVSKYLWQCIKQDGILYACFLKTFPGIRDLPCEKESRFYLKTLSVYYRPHFAGSMTNHELITFIGVSIRDTNERIPMRRIVSDVCAELAILFWCAAGRKNIIDCVSDWKKIISDTKGCRLEVCGKAMEILDRIAAVARSSFSFIGAEEFYGFLSR